MTDLKEPEVAYWDESQHIWSEGSSLLYILPSATKTIAWLPGTSLDRWNTIIYRQWLIPLDWHITQAFSIPQWAYIRDE